MVVGQQYEMCFHMQSSNNHTRTFSIMCRSCIYNPLTS